MRTKKAILLVFLILLPILMRASYLKSDLPPTAYVGTHNADEGGWMHNARNEVLFGKWIMENDEWNPVFVSPLFTLSTYLSFRIFGPGIVAARLVSVFFSLASIAIFYFTLKNYLNKRFALIGTFLLSYNFIYLAFSRSAMLEAFSIFFLILTFYFFQKSTKNWKFLILAGAASLLAFLAKPSNIHFFPVVLLSTIALVFRHPGKEKFRLGIKACLSLFLGWISVGAVYLFTILVPFYDYVKFMLIDTYLLPRSSNTPLVIKLFNILTIGFDKPIFAKMPLVSITAFIFFIFLAGKALDKFKEVRTLDLFAFNWIAFSLVYFFIFDAPLRRMVQIIPALVFLSSLFLYSLGRKPLAFKAAGRASKIIIPVLWFFLAYSIIANLFKYGFFGHTDFFVNETTAFFHNLFSFNLRSYFVTSLLSLFFSLIVIAPLAILYLFFKTKIKALFFNILHFANKNHKLFLIFILLAEFSLGMFYFYHFVVRADNSYYRASVELGKLIQNEKIQGVIAASFTTENNNIPIDIEPRFANYNDRFNRPDVEHFILELPDTYGKLDRNISASVLLSDPDVADWLDNYPNSTLIWTYKLSDRKDTKIGLFKKNLRRK